MTGAMAASAAMQRRPEPRLVPADAAQILLGWQRNARSAMQWLHRDWLALALGIEYQTGVDATLAALRERCDEACSLAVLRVLLPESPTIDTFIQAPAARLDALPVETGLRVLRMLALLARRAEVRRLVDRTTRKRLAQWIGCPLDELLGKAMPEAPSLVDAKREHPGSLALGSLDADALAHQGLALLPRNGTHQTLLKFALPRADSEPQAMFANDERDESSAFLRERIGPLLPEYAWLSG